MMLFGQLLRELRLQARLKLKDVSEKLGWTVVYLSDIELGRRNPPTPERIRQIADVLRIDPQELLERAALDRQKVTLTLANRTAIQSEAAMILARSWEHLSEEQARGIVKILRPERSHYG